MATAIRTKRKVGVINAPRRLREKRESLTPAGPVIGGGLVVGSTEVARLATVPGEQSAAGRIHDKWRLSFELIRSDCAAIALSLSGSGLLAIG